MLQNMQCLNENMHQIMTKNIFLVNCQHRIRVWAHPGFLVRRNSHSLTQNAFLKISESNKIEWCEYQTHHTTSPVPDYGFEGPYIRAKTLAGSNYIYIYSIKYNKPSTVQPSHRKSYTASQFYSYSNEGQFIYFI